MCAFGSFFLLIVKVIPYTEGLQIRALEVDANRRDSFR